MSLKPSCQEQNKIIKISSVLRNYKKLNNQAPLLCVAVLIFLLGLTYFTFANDTRFCGDSFVSGDLADARVLVPFLADDTASASICGFIFSGLTKIDKDLHVIGDLAESWDISEDKKVITFYLKKNIFWHDKTPFTANDVKFTFEQILDPQNKSPYGSNYKNIEKIEIVDPYTVRFYYSVAYAPALSKLGVGIIPEHICKNKKYSDFSDSPVGTGPYIFKKWLKNQFIMLSANSIYYEHIPFIQQYISRTIPDQSVQFLELLSGGIDQASLTPDQYFYRTNQKVFRQNFNIYKYLSLGYTYMGYNLKDELFADKRVRQALSYAIDKKRIIQGVLLGLGEECSGPFSKNSEYYNNNAETYSYNKEKAMQLLNESGWHDINGDGILEKNGKKFRFTLITNQGNKTREDIAVLVQEDLAKIGVKVDVRTIAWSAFLNEFIDKRKFQAVILGWSIPIDPDCYSVWHSDNIGGNGLNFVSYKNEKVDELIKKGRETFNTDMRARIYQEIHSLIADDAPYTFLFVPYATVSISKRFRGIAVEKSGIYYNFIDWYVMPDEQKFNFINK